MRHKGRTMLAALVAVCALGAVASASAWAAPPEFTLKTGEKFPSVIEGSTESVSAGFGSEASLSATCNTNKTTGEITGAKAVPLTLEWTGCRQGSTSLTSEGAPSGDIIVAGTGSLVFIDEAERRVGILFTLKTTKIEAGTAKETLNGSVVIPIEPINTETSKFHLAIDQDGPGEPKYKHYENEKGEVESATLLIEFNGAGPWLASIYVGSALTSVTSNKPLSVATSVPPPLWLSSFGSAGIESSKFSNPEAAAVAPGGNVYVADTGNDRVQEFTSSGAFVEAFGWGVSNGKAEFQICTSKCQAGIAGSGTGQFNVPDGIAVGLKGQVYVADGANQRIEEFSSEGKYLGEWGGEGNGEGQFGYKSPWGWEGPRGVAVAPNGRVYVTDENSVQEFTAGGEEFRKKWSLESAPHGIAVSSGENVYVAEEGTAHIQEFSSSGTLIRTWGSEGTGNKQFRCPHGVSAGPNGEVFVADECNDRVEEFSSFGVYTTQWGTPGTGNGQFSSPSDVAVASNGNVYVVDKDNDRIQKFE